MSDHDRGIDTLADFLGEDVARGLHRWAESNRRQVFLPPQPWRASGFTDAFVASLVVHDPDLGDLNLAFKVAPLDARRERSAHADALSDAPARFRKTHMVELKFDLVELGEGQIGYFQDLAGGTRDMRPVGDMVEARQAEDLVATCLEVASGIAEEWNDAKARRPRGKLPTVAEFLEDEVLHLSSGGLRSIQNWSAPLGLDDPHTLWVRTAEDAASERPPTPNPVLMLTGYPGLGDHRISPLLGRGHGDLHLGNIVILWDDRGAHPGTYRLIDLSTYCRDQPRSRDLATLLLSCVAHIWPTLSVLQRELLLDDLAYFDRPPHVRQDGLVTQLINGIPATTSEVAFGAGFTHEWLVDFTLALLAAALRNTTFNGMGPERRWWFVRLAGRLAARYFRVTGVAINPDHVQDLCDPFKSAHRPAMAPPSTPSTSPSREPPAKAAGGLTGLMHGGMSIADERR